MSALCFALIASLVVLLAGEMVPAAAGPPELSPAGAFIVAGAEMRLPSAPPPGYRVVEFGGAVLFSPSTVRPHAGRAIEALEATAEPPTPPLWPPDRAISAAPESTVPFRGRVVIELWERSVLIAVTAPAGDAADLLREAAEALRRFRDTPA